MWNPPAELCFADPGAGLGDVWQHQNPPEAPAELGLSLGHSVLVNPWSLQCCSQPGLWYQRWNVPGGKGEKKILFGGTGRVWFSLLRVRRWLGMVLERWKMKTPTPQSGFHPQIWVLNPPQAGLSILNIQISFKNGLLKHKCQLRTNKEKLKLNSQQNYRWKPTRNSQR